MVKVLQILGASALLSSSVVLVLCVARLLQAAQQIKHSPEPSVVEKFRQARNGGETSSPVVRAPLVEQAEAFALYLNPPELQKSAEDAVAGSSSRTISAVRPVRLTAKFRLVATSYYRLKPEESMALISEPGAGYRWVKQGAHLGHFVVEKVERGRIIYRNGDRRGEMAVDRKVSGHPTQAHQPTPVQDQTSAALSRSSILAKRKDENRQAWSPEAKAAIDSVR